MRQRQLMPAIGLLLMATMFWGGMFPIAKHALAVMDAYYMTLIRFIGTALILLLVLLKYEGTAALRCEGRVLYLFFIGSLGFAGFNLLAFNGLAHSRPEHGAIIMGLQPMIAILLTWLLKRETPAPFTLATVLLAFVGVFLVITGGDPAALTGGAAQWDLLFLAGALCWVAYTLGAQRLPHWSPLRYTTLTCCFGTLCIGLITLLLTLNGQLQLPALNTLLTEGWTFAYLTLCGGAIAVLSWNTGIRRLGAINGVLFINFVPITAFTIGILEGREFSAVELSGAACVVLALVSNNLYLRRQTARASATPSAVACRS